MKSPFRLVRLAWARTVIAVSTVGHHGECIARTYRGSSEAADRPDGIAALENGPELGVRLPVPSEQAPYILQEIAWLIHHAWPVVPCPDCFQAVDSRIAIRSRAVESRPGRIAGGVASSLVSMSNWVN